MSHKEKKAKKTTTFQSSLTMMQTKVQKEKRAGVDCMKEDTLTVLARLHRHYVAGMGLDWTT